MREDLPTCDCLNECGDDHRIDKGSAKKCSYRKAHDELQAHKISNPHFADLAGQLLWSSFRTLASADCIKADALLRSGWAEANAAMASKPFDLKFVIVSSVVRMSYDPEEFKFFSPDEIASLWEVNLSECAVVYDRAPSNFPKKLSGLPVLSGFPLDADYKKLRLFYNI